MTCTLLWKGMKATQSPSARPCSPQESIWLSSTCLIPLALKSWKVWKAQGLRSLPALHRCLLIWGTYLNSGSYCFLFFFFSFIHCYFYFLTLLGALGLHCCTQAFSSCSAKGRLSGMAYRPPTAAAPLVVDHRLQVHGLQWLQLAGLIALRHVGSFQTPEKIEPHPLHWQANSFPLYIREVPSSYCFLLSKRAITISTPQITVMVKKLS